MTQASRYKTVLVTNPTRTVVDLAASVLGHADLTDAVDVALAKRLVTVDGLMAELDRLAQPWPSRGGSTPPPPP